MKIEQFFFELIQVALGIRVCLSHSPTAEEWKALYDMAKKQSLVGVCFAGVQLLQQQRQEPPEMLYLTWMGMAAKVQQRNEVVSKQCVEVYEMLKADGLDNCILKGQGVGRYYGSLKELRQSGDIDVWVNATEHDTIKWSITQSGKKNVHDYHHIDADVFADTQVELHFRPTLSRNICRDLKIQKWSKRYANEFMYDKSVGFDVSPLEFDVVFILHHIYWHVMFGGCGLRQLMDLYFVLCQERTEVQNAEIKDSLRYLGMERFASAVMHIMQVVFGLNTEQLLCEANTKVGEFLLNDILRTGNMGHHDEIKKKTNGSRLSYLWRDTTYGFRLFRYFPIDVLWIPFGMIYISLKGKMIK